MAHITDDDQDNTFSTEHPADLSQESWRIHKPALSIPPYLLARIFAYADTCLGFEVSGFGLVDVSDNRRRIVVEDVFLLKQRVTTSSVHIEPADMADFLSQMVTQGYDVGRLRFWFHSHGTMPAFHSATDMETLHQALGNAPWFVSLVVNNSGQMDARLVVNQPIKLTLRDLPVILHIDSQQRAAAARDVLNLVTFRRYEVVDINSPQYDLSDNGHGSGG
ncbi:MAG: Mov34/MPN/PAD-1 family protein [Anaerolineae bacterium]|nr:Mov34/MPN/PAD-1 family protein [Anaerolineae bacterium]